MTESASEQEHHVDDVGFDELLERSSLGTAGARQLRQRISRAEAESIRQLAYGTSGELTEFEMLYVELVPGLIRYLQRILQPSSGLAEDVAQDAFLVLMRKWPDVRDHPHLKAWLYAVARHLAFDMLKERSREFLREEPPDQEGAARADLSDSYNVSAAVRAAVGKLPARQREAVWLFYLLNFTQNEIATIMQIQRGTVSALLFQARSRIAGLLGSPDAEGSTKALRSLEGTLREPAGDAEAGRQRLREAGRRLEERRIDDLAKLIDGYEKDYRLGQEALLKQEFDMAEHYLRRSAQHGNDEAAYWLGLLLEMRSTRQRLNDSPGKTGKLAAEAQAWRRRAQESGLADALDEALPAR